MWLSCCSPEPSSSYRLLVLISLLTIYSEVVLTISNENSTQSSTSSGNFSVTIDRDLELKSTSHSEKPTLPFAQTLFAISEEELERERRVIVNATHGHVTTAASFPTTDDFLNDTNDDDTAEMRVTGTVPSTSAYDTRTQEIARTHRMDSEGRLTNDWNRQTDEASNKTSGGSWSLNTTVDRSREPALKQHLRRGEPAEQRKNRTPFNSHIGENDEVSYDNSHSYHRIGADDYLTVDEAGDRAANNPLRQDPFRDYDDLQYDAGQPQNLRLNFSDLSLARGGDSWPRNNRIEYEDLYDSHLIQDIPDDSSVIKRIVSLRGKLSSDRINISLIVIYGWLALVLLTIITALLVLRYKHQLSSECSRISTVLRLSGSSKGPRGLEEGNNLLAHPLA